VVEQLSVTALAIHFAPPRDLISIDNEATRMLSNKVGIRANGHPIDLADRGKSDGYFKILNPWGFAIIQASVLTDAESTMVLEMNAAIR
jgi:hypothetical protein